MQSMNTTPRFTRGATFVAAMVLTGVLAQAQQASTANPAPADDKVVVLEKFTVQAGFSGSLAAAAEAKSKSQNIVEVIMSERNCTRCSLWRTCGWRAERCWYWMSNSARNAPKRREHGPKGSNAMGNAPKFEVSEEKMLIRGVPPQVPHWMGGCSDLP